MRKESRATVLLNRAMVQGIDECDKQEIFDNLQIEQRNGFYLIVDKEGKFILSNKNPEKLQKQIEDFEDMKKHLLIPFRA